jgi:hypothetical protein
MIDHLVEVLDAFDEIALLDHPAGLKNQLELLAFPFKKSSGTKLAHTQHRWFLQSVYARNPK